MVKFFSTLLDFFGNGGFKEVEWWIGGLVDSWIRGLVDSWIG